MRSYVTPLLTNITVLNSTQPPSLLGRAVFFITFVFYFYLMKHLIFRKSERLCSKVLLDRLFSEGKSTYSYPYKFFFLEVGQPDDPDIRVVFSVPKKIFKQAVKRNLIKRRMKEAYRLNKELITEKNCGRKIIVMVIYTEKEILDYKTIETFLIKGFKKIISSLNK